MAHIPLFRDKRFYLGHGNRPTVWREVHLVGDEHKLTHATVPFVHKLLPAYQMVERVSATYIKHQIHNIHISDVRRNDATEALLTGGVPQLQADSVAVRGPVLAGVEVDADGWGVFASVAKVVLEQRGFAHRIVPKQDTFQQHTQSCRGRDGECRRIGRHHDSQVVLRGTKK